MDTKYLSLLFVAIAVAVAGCHTPAGGRWPQQGTVSPSDAAPKAVIVPSNQLALSVAPERSSYRVGEPVYLAITLRNTSERAERVIGSLHPEDGAVDVVIATLDGRQREYVPLGEADHDETIFQSLAPGATIGNMVPVFFGGAGWTFDKPGRYTITAYYRLPDGKKTVRESKSTPVTIDIEASPEGSKLIGDGQASREAGKFLTWQAGDHLEKGRSQLSELMQQTPDSPLASYANFAFGRSWGDSFMDYRNRLVRPANCELAMRHLAKLRDADVTDFIRVQSAITSARCAAQRKEFGAARGHIGSVKKMAGAKPEYRSILVRLAELEKYVNQTN